MSDPYIAEITIVGFNFAPRGWAFCSGQLLPISQNTALFSLLGTTYGGNGTTNFALPDLRGRAPLHRGNGPGLTPRDLGEAGGAETVTLQTTQIPAHSHTMQGDGSGGGLVTPANNTWGKKAARSPTPLYQSGAPAAAMSQGALTTTGGSQPHNNLSPYTTLNFIICLQGIYPSRN